MATFVNAHPDVNVRVGPGKKYPFVASHSWMNGEEVERDGHLVNDGSYDWQRCIRVKNRYDKGYIRNDFLVDRS